MFVKVFTQILDSTIAEDWQTRHVFEDLLKLADKEGRVDMTLGSISRRTGVPLEIVSRALDQLSQPDPQSRSAAEDGRRIVLIDEHRDWGWRIVNYSSYRSIRDDEGRKEYFREAKRAQRAKDAESKTVQDSQGMSSNVTDADADADVDKKSKKPSAATRRACENIYDAYPKKVAKQEALKAIEKACTQIPPDELLRRVKAFADQMRIEGKDPQYIPYPATWFNRGSYDDDFTPHVPPRKEANGYSNPGITDAELRAALGR